MSYNLLVILGPTAVGKTRLAALLADDFNGEIISADSRQVYRGMDIGTGKDIADYTVNGKLTPYHLIDIIDPSEEFNLFLFQKYFRKYFSEILERKNIPILCGGTGLYLHSILKHYNLADVEMKGERYNLLMEKSIDELKQILTSKKSDLHNVTDLIDKERIVKAVLIAEAAEVNFKIESNVHAFIIGVKLEREQIKKNITQRLKYRLQNGMIEEVQKLIDDGISFDKLNFFGLEYRYVGQHLKGELNYNDMYQKLNSTIHSFAKRQMTWFRKMEREGINIHWLDGPNLKAAQKLISSNFTKP